MSDKAQGLSGYWTGEYDYPHSFSPVAFNAHLIEDGDGLTGSITEPDTHKFFDTIIVMSTLVGSKEGANVRFIKRMQNAGRHDPIHYIGLVNEAQTQIRGRWIIAGEWSGNFQMSRGDLEEPAAVVAHDEVDA